MKKYLTIILSLLMVFASLFTVFAETSTTETKFKANDERPEKRELPENMIFGKIKSINATSVTIELATRKEMSRPKNGKDNDGMRKPPEKPDNEQNSNSKPEKPNMDDMFTLTGETKTINISQADFGANFEKGFERGSKPEDTNQNNKENKKPDIAKQNTYEDYSVGDYIMIETTDNSYSTAKSVRDAGRMGGGPGGPGGPRNDNGQNNKQDPPTT